MDDLFSVIASAIPKKEIDALKNIIIFKEDDKTYNVYDRYLVTKNNDGIYEVSVIGTHTLKSFYKLKNAIAWCSFDKRNLFKGARRLHQLDQMIFSMDTEIQLHSKLVKKSSDVELKLIYLSKLTQDKAKKKLYSGELSRYLDEYQRWQNNLFNAKPAY